MSRARKTVPAPDKLAILKKHLVEKVPISDLCDQHGLQPSQIYSWQALLFEHGAAAFDRKAGRQGKAAETAKDQKIARLEATVAQREARRTKSSPS
jgi:transposase